jgi:hypothetical protein
MKRKTRPSAKALKAGKQLAASAMSATHFGTAFHGALSEHERFRRDVWLRAFQQWISTSGDIGNAVTSANAGLAGFDAAFPVNDVTITTDVNFKP